ncbi:FtsK/SpoIIIE domain-containing protein [Pseudolysinimonas sp.]|uniref:FtsK/SpoIIIE domain-containing protein n=1 Tax=Pseudolysinimonas sp. TaxID=2680009 RepID=UPI00286A3DE4|nr:FtsK/SpoIIIE domain-containing protein [Pseudolysinimonas sp.]
MIAPPSVRIPAPPVEAEPLKSGFPVIATTAPVVVAGVLFAVTGSPFMLLMAVLGPVIAVATLADGRRQRRRAARSAAARFAAGLEDATERVARARDAERHRLAGFVSLDALWGVADAPLVIAVARGAAPSGIDVSGSAGVSEPPELTRLRDDAATIPGAPLVRAIETGLEVDGPAVLAAAVARTLAVRIAARRSPATTSCQFPPGEDWMQRLPHETLGGDPGRYRFVSGDHETVIAWAPGSVAGAPRIDARKADATTRAAAGHAADRLADAARSAGIRPASAGLPDRVALGDLLALPMARSGLSAPLGVAADGVAVIDLIADGPHAVVAGTTGAGKSELLTSWVLGMAAGRSPREVSFVLVDFKGGAAFAPLSGLPHVLGTLSDLDASLARRAIESLRAEVRRREQVLAATEVRAIEELPVGELARLVVIVDEFAALVTELPELHALFADLAARGRSLGVHLILCTQRPAGVVRDAVLANVAVRIALRVADRADSLGLVGDDSAARLPPHPRGRAVVVDGAGNRRTVQLALAAPSDVERITRATPAGSSSRPWCDPLPAVIPHHSLPSADGIPFGLRDLPAEQRQPVAAIEPRHGHVLVLGAPGSGTSTALSAVAAGAGDAARWLPEDPVEMWGLLAHPGRLPDGGLLLIDDVDLVLARCPVDHAVELADLLARLLRDGPARGIRVVAGARRLAGPVHGFAPLFGARLLLRLGSREEHVLAGGQGETFDPRAQPGAGIWEGAVVQVALPEPSPRRMVVGVPPVVVGVPERGELAVVASRPRELADRWDPARVRVRRLGEPDVGDPVIDPGRTVLLGDPEAWQADWATLARARRDLPIVIHGCGVADVRAITRTREVPPPLSPGEVWLVENGGVRRAVLAA